MKPLRDVFGDTLVQLADGNPNLLVLDADLANSTKADKFAAAHPGRFLDVMRLALDGLWPNRK